MREWIKMNTELIAQLDEKKRCRSHINSVVDQLAQLCSTMENNDTQKLSL